MLLHLFPSSHPLLPVPSRFFSHSSTPCRTTPLCLYRPFYFESHDPLSPQTFAQHASPPFLFTASKLLFFAYLLSYPSLGPDFVHTTWSGTYSFSFTKRYLSSRKKGTREKEVGWSEILYTRDCSVVQFDFFSCGYKLHFSKDE